MQCTLLIPHLFWPRDSLEKVSQDLSLPALATLLARARVDRHPAVTRDAWLCQAFEVERQQDWPVAPLTFNLDADEPGDAYCLRADPIHIKVSREGLHVVDSAVFDVGEDEAQALVAALNTHFADAITFVAPHPKRWYVKPARAPDLATHTISEVAGGDVQHYLPSGADAPAWRALFNESQMVLHEHAINQARESRGEPEINSVWFWGGGIRPSVPGRHFNAVWSDDPLACALGTLADARSESVPTSGAAWLAAARSPARESHLVMLDQLNTAVTYNDSDAWRTRLSELDATWFAGLLAALRHGDMKRLTLVTLGEQASCRFTVTRFDLFKLWRRPQPLWVYA
ncbi:MAG: phosphoglycerate mutase [Pseudomonadota bacterium]